HGEGESLLDETLKELEDEFNGRFVRIHRNALASIAHIEGLERNSDGQYYVRLAGIDVRPQVSRRHVAPLRTLLDQIYGLATSAKLPATVDRIKPWLFPVPCASLPARVPSPCGRRNMSNPASRHSTPGCRWRSSASPPGVTSSSTRPSPRSAARACS